MYYFASRNTIGDFHDWKRKWAFLQKLCALISTNWVWSMLWGLVYVFSSMVMSLPGLQSYHADSEISDSEGETSPVHDPPPAPGVGKFRTTYLQHESLSLPL